MPVISLVATLLTRFATLSSLVATLLTRFATLSAGLRPEPRSLRSQIEWSLRSRDWLRLVLRKGQAPSGAIPTLVCCRNASHLRGFSPKPRRQVPRASPYPRFARGLVSCSTSWRVMWGASLPVSFGHVLPRYARSVTLGRASPSTSSFLG